MVTDTSSIYGSLSNATSSTASAANAANTALTESATDVGGDFDTFLQMLTTQMQNQDPLNPDNPTDFATQLAQFSAVEQSVLTNDLLAQVLNALTVSESPASQMADWIGRDALVQTDANYDGDPITIKALINNAADHAEFVVRNASGQEVLRSDLGVDNTEIVWEGGNNYGEEVAAGTYSLTIESYLGDELISAESGLIFQNVKEARIIGNELILSLQDGTEILASDAYGMRQSTES